MRPWPLARPQAVAGSGRVPSPRFMSDNLPWLATGVALTFTSSFGQTFFISVFSGEIMAEFHLSAGAWGRIYSAATTVSGLAMIWAGALADRFRVRALGCVVLALLAAACLSMAALPGVWALPAAIFALRFTGQGMTSHLAVTAMARWFVAARGRALSTAALGLSAGEAVLPVTVVAALGVLPWRLLWLGVAVVPLAMLPLLLRLLTRERTPQSVAADLPVAGMADRHWRRGEVLSHWLFWLAVPALLAPPAFSTAFFFQQVHLAAVKGWSHVGLVALFPLFTAAAIAAMLGSGAAIDRIGTGRMMPLYQLPMAVGFAVVAAAGTLGTAAVGVALIGATAGANMTVPNAFWAEYYGTRHIGAIKAMAAAVMVLGTAIGPALSGTLIDAGIVFPRQMPVIAVYILAAAGLTALGLRRARPLLPAPA